MRCITTLLIATVISSFIFDLIKSDGESDKPLGEDDLSIPGWLKSKSSQKLVARRRTRRSALSLPPNTSVRVTLDLSTAVNPLKNTFTYLTIDLPFRFVLPTYKDLASIYGKSESTDEHANNLNAGFPIDYHFLEEQRANSQRRNIYKHIETALKKFGIDGELCLQRAICELAESPLFGHHGLFGKFISLIFSPSVPEIPQGMKSVLSNPDDVSNRIRRETTLNQEERDLLDEPLEDQYTRAYRNGKAKLCWACYSSCPISVLTMLNF